MTEGLRCCGVLEGPHPDGTWWLIRTDLGDGFWAHEDALVTDVGRLNPGVKIAFSVTVRRSGRSEATHIELLEDPATSDRTYTGVVTEFKEQPGYGFIVTEDRERFFAHRSKIRGDGYRYLAPGEPVLFELTFNAEKDRHEAVDIRPPDHRRRGIVASFDDGKGFGRIRPEGGGPTLFLHHTNILRHGPQRRVAEPDELVEYHERADDKGPVAVDVKRLDPREPLNRFADMGDEERWLTTLAELAADEPWAYQKTQSSCIMPVLRNYLTYTYARLAAEARAEPDPTRQKVQVGADNAGRRHACFNTGLVTPNQEPVFALFSRNPTRSDGRDWKLSTFCTRSDRRLMGVFSHLPTMAYYFDNIGELLYDPSVDLQLDVDHILSRLDRFPKSVRNDIESNPQMGPRYLERVKSDAVSRVKRDSKTAVPSYYQGRVQFLLPLFLESRHQADLALTVTRVGAHYLGATVLTLDMAYNNARLLAKPDTEWLQP